MRASRSDTPLASPIRELHAALLPLMMINFVESNPGPVKAARVLILGAGPIGLLLTLTLVGATKAKLDPDHKVEYTHAEMSAKLEQAEAALQQARA